MPIISIIIPVYNDEKYVAECIESVVRQQDGSVECIIVDDGSTDNSLVIINDIVSKHPGLNLKVIHQNNMGLSGARNTGIGSSVGEYILFLDSDDMLVDGAIEVLKKKIAKSPRLDLILFDAVVQNETAEDYSLSAYDRSNRIGRSVMDGEEYFSDWYVSNRVLSACMRLYRSGLIKDKHISFSVGKLHEDISFGFKIVLSAKRIQYIPDKLYVRRVRPNSITMSRPGTGHYHGIISAFEESMDFWDEGILRRKNHIDIKLSNSFDGYLLFGVRYIIDSCKACNGEISEATDTINRMLEHLIAPVLVCSYTRLSVLMQMLTIIEEESVEPSKSNISLMNTCYNDHSIKIVRGILEEGITRSRHRVIESLPLDEKGIVVGIYGMGVHTMKLIDDFCKLKSLSNPKADIYFIETHKSNGTPTLFGKKLYGIKELPGNTDYFIVSSWIHHDEMLNYLLKYADDSSKIIDLYAIEKTPLYG